MAVPQLSLKLRFYRQCRLWHGYLSAFAFAALLFFSATGLVLNHPTWFASNQPRNAPVRFTLSASQLQQLRGARDPGRLLAKMVGTRTKLYGEFQDGDSDMGQIFVHLRGARGSSDIRANTRDGSIEVVSDRATISGVLNTLHRGDLAGAAWRRFIDIAAAVLIVVSIVGYAIFFSMTTRLTTALLITAVSVLGIVMFFVAVVP